MRTVKYLLMLAVVGVLVGVAFIYSGVYPVGADVPHHKLTYWIMEEVRDRSIASASHNIDVPKMDDPDLLQAGGGDYDAMCSICHLKPGQAQSEMSQGLYPAPPNLSRRRKDHSGQGYSNQESAEEERAQRQFWVIKHGIKASGMPAWGPTHDDKRIWAMVAFLQKLPELSIGEYQALTAQDGHGHDHSHH